MPVYGIYDKDRKFLAFVRATKPEAQAYISKTPEAENGTSAFPIESREELIDWTIKELRKKEGKSKIESVLYLRSIGFFDIPFLDITNTSPRRAHAKSHS